jgi:hypothetical protein
MPPCIPRRFSCLRVALAAPFSPKTRFCSTASSITRPGPSSAPQRSSTLSTRSRVSTRPQNPVKQIRDFGSNNAAGRWLAPPTMRREGRTPAPASGMHDTLPATHQVESNNPVACTVLTKSNQTIRRRAQRGTRQGGAPKRSRPHAEHRRLDDPRRPATTRDDPRRSPHFERIDRSRSSTVAVPSRCSRIGSNRAYPPIKSIKSSGAPPPLAPPLTPRRLPALRRPSARPRARPEADSHSAGAPPPARSTRGRLA